MALDPVEMLIQLSNAEQLSQPGGSRKRKSRWDSEQPEAASVPGPSQAIPTAEPVFIPPPMSQGSLPMGQGALPMSQGCLPMSQGALPTKAPLLPTPPMKPGLLP